MADCNIAPILIIGILVLLVLYYLFQNNLTTNTEEVAVREHFNTYGHQYRYGHPYWNNYYNRYPWSRNWHRYLNTYYPNGYYSNYYSPYGYDYGTYSNIEYTY